MILPFLFNDRLLSITGGPSDSLNDPYVGATAEAAEDPKWFGDADAYTREKVYRDARGGSINYATELRVYLPATLAEVEPGDWLHLQTAGALVVRQILSGVGDEYDPIAPYIVVVADKVSDDGAS